MFVVLISIAFLRQRAAMAAGAFRRPSHQHGGMTPRPEGRHHDIFSRLLNRNPNPIRLKAPDRARAPAGGDHRGGRRASALGGRY